MKTAYAVLALFVLAPVANARTDEFRGVHRLDLRVSQGDVRVLGVDGDTATVAVVKKRYDERCRLTVERRGDLLFVELASKSLFRARCEADFEIRVPRSVGLRFRTGSGNVSVSGTTGAMAVQTGSGKVDVKAKLLAFEAQVGSGSLRAEGLESPANVRTGSGSVRLVYEKVPADGELAIRSGSGDAQVQFPRHARVRTSFTAGSGSLRNRLGDSPGAKFTVSMTTGSGNLVVE